MNKNRQLNIRMTQSEFSEFRDRAAKAGLSQSAYIRILLGGSIPRPEPPLEYDKLMIELYTLRGELKKRGATGEIIDLFHQLLLSIQAAVLLPEKRE